VSTWSLIGSFLTARWWTVVAATGVILAALYLLWAYQRVFHGEPVGDNDTDDRPEDWASAGLMAVLRGRDRLLWVCTRSRCWIASVPRWSGWSLQVERHADYRAPEKPTCTDRRRSPTHHSTPAWPGEGEG
jgi:hypothetical protein